MSGQVFEYIVLDPTAGSSIDDTVQRAISDIYSDSKIGFIKHRSTNVKDLITYLILKNRYPNTDNYEEINTWEIELNHPILLFINTDTYKSQSSELNSLSLDDLKLLISDFFHHLNIIIETYTNSSTIHIPKQTITVTASLLKNRMTRVLSWIGYECANEKVKYSAISSMVDDLSCAAISKERHFTELLVKEIDYYSWLKLNHPKSFYIDKIYEWGFKSHLLSYDELLYCSKCILEIATNNCGSSWTINDENRLLAFAFNVRDNYRMGNQFHNFRHAVDVLQATFYILVKLDCLPDKTENKTGQNLLSKVLLPPPITLTLLIASFGHDIGHPGLTNKFLVDNKTPIAKYFSDISVLESFHYTEFKSILDKFFPDIFHEIHGSEEIIRKSILSTDMMNHFSYIEKIDDFMKFQNKMDHCVNTSNDVIEIRYLLCSLVIKCADISNVSRPLEVSAKWGVSLTNEINEIQTLEKTIQNPEGDYANDYKHSITELKAITPKEIVDRLPSICGGQCFFINNFVMMFFEKIQIILPSLKFLYYHINENVAYWESCQAE